MARCVLQGESCGLSESSASAAVIWITSFLVSLQNFGFGGVQGKRIPGLLRRDPFAFFALLLSRLPTGNLQG